MAQCHGRNGRAVEISHPAPFAGRPAVSSAAHGRTTCLGLLRSRADEWKLDRSRIGIFGFSAGGHLAAMASNHHAERRYEPVDEHDRVSCRPDFCCLFYPAYLTNPILELKPDPALDQAHITPERHAADLYHGRPSGQVHRRLCKLLRRVANGEGSGGTTCVVFRRARRFVRPVSLVGWGYEGLRFLHDHKVLDDEAVAAGRAWIEQEEAKLHSDPKTLRPDTNWSGESGAASRDAGFETRTCRRFADERLSRGDDDARKLLGPGVPIIPLWPNGTRDDDPLAAGGDQLPTKNKTRILSRKRGLRIADVTRPTLAVLRPEKPDGRAVNHFPGRRLPLPIARPRGDRRRPPLQPARLSRPSCSSTACRNATVFLLPCKMRSVP